MSLTYLRTYDTVWLTNLDRNIQIVAITGLLKLPYDIRNLTLSGTVITKKSTVSTQRRLRYIHKKIYKAFHSTVKVSVSPESNALLRGGGLDDTYKLAQFHFHWGSNDFHGSEHRIDGREFPMEVSLE